MNNFVRRHIARGFGDLGFTNPFDGTPPPIPYGRDARNLPPSQSSSVVFVPLNPNYGSIFNTTPPAFPSTGGSSSSSGQQPSNVAYITNAIVSGFNLIGTWLQTKNAQGQTTSIAFNPATRQYVDTRTGQVVGTAPGGDDEDVGAGKDSINIFGQQVKYTTLLVGALAIYLFQAKGVQRRS